MSHKATYWLAQLDPDAVKAGAFRILFHLCDHHNDQRDPERSCFPSQETLREKTKLSNGALNNALNEMEADGLIRRIKGTLPESKERRTYYILGCDIKSNNNQTPESGVSKNEQTPVLGITNSSLEGNKLQPTGDYPVRNHKEPVSNAEPSKDLLSKTGTPLPKWLNREVWNDYCSHKTKKNKNVAMSKRQKELLLAKLKEVYDAGVDPNAALDHAIERGWIGFKVEHVLNANIQKRTDGKAAGRDPSDPMVGLPANVASAIRNEINQDRRRALAEAYWRKQETAGAA